METVDRQEELMEIIYHKSAIKYLKSIEKKTRDGILASIDLLTQYPPVGDIKPMQGMNGMYRLRCGKYRVIYGFCDGKLEIIKVGARGDIYK